MVKLPNPATEPTMYFIGVTTGQSSIMRIFPIWAKALGVQGCLKGIDIAIHAPAEDYRAAVEFIRSDPLSLGALVTTHKIDLLNACRDLFDELRNGCVENREVRPGAVKAAVGPEGLVGAAAERYRAAAEAAARAEVPLVVHTEKGLDGVRAVELACACGMPVHRVLICHADRQAADFAPHEAIADTGAMLEYDTIGRFKYHDDEAECRLILHMLERGHERQLLFSLDTTRERLSTYGGAIGLNYILDVFLPMLAASGISEQTLRRITVDNPARVFE